LIPTTNGGVRALQMGCKARIKSLHTGETHYGECVDLSVDGMAFVVRLFPSMANACL
jgi:hypothetical protein